MDDGPIDIRTYPIPKWSSRSLRAVTNGNWTCFYNQDNLDTVFDFEPYSCKTRSILATRTPLGLTCQSSLSTTTRSIQEPSKNYIDSYTLFKRTQKVVKRHQQLFIDTNGKNRSSTYTQKMKQPSETFVPSETNVIEKLHPIIPENPIVDIKNARKQQKEKPTSELLTNTERNGTIQLNVHRSSLDNVYFFHHPPQKKGEPEDQVRQLIEEMSNAKEARRSMSTMRSRYEQKVFHFHPYSRPGILTYSREGTINLS